MAKKYNTKSKKDKGLKGELQNLKDEELRKGMLEEAKTKAKVNSSY